MAWRNAEIPLATCINNNDTYWTAFPTSAAVSWNTYAPYMTNTNPIPHSDLVPSWVYGDTTLGIRIRGDFDVIIEFIKNNVVYLTLSSMIPALYPNDNYILFCGVNDETQKGSAFLMTYYADNNTAKLNSYSTRNGWEDVLYEILTAAAPILYQWSSVPAISGKNGILSLSMIKDEFIGDGSPVEGAPLSNIEQFTDGSRFGYINSQLETDQVIDFIYSGDNYRMTYERTGAVSCKCSFYLLPTTPGAQPSAFYTKQFALLGNRYMAFIVDHENEVAAFTSIIRSSHEGEPDTVSYLVSGLPDEETMHLLYIWLQGSALPENWTDLDNFEDPPAEGGGDKLIRANNPVPIPGVPQASAYDSGFMSQWKVTKTQLQSLSRFLWSDNFVDNVKKFFNDPRQIIMGITIFPVLPTVADNPAEIKAGGISTGVNGYKLLYQFERHSMGRCYIPKSLSNGIYWDYEPFTRARIYLPFCGEHELNISDIMGKTLQLDYTVDYVSGMCCAHISIVDEENDLPNNCHYNYTGQMGIQIPVSSEDFGGFYRAMLSAGVGVGGAIATMASGGLTAPLMATMGAANAIGNIANMGKDVQYTSGGGSISGSLASEYPYITIEEPIAFQAPNQQHYIGEPLYDTKALKDVSGFTKIAAIHLDGLSCTESEREIIRAQLSKGVIIQEGDELPTPSSGDELCKIMLLTNLSDVDTIGKKFYKSNGEVAYIEIKSDLVYNQNYTRVGLLINQFDASCNYVYIPSFGRCYYVDSVTVESGAMSRLDLVVDASESFWDELKECEAVIESNEHNYRLMLNNNTWYMQQNKNIKTLTFKINDAESPDNGKAAHFSRAANQTPFILTIAGDDDA